MTDKVIIVGGGTFNHVAAHLALAAPAFGNTARQVFQLFKDHQHGMAPELLLTKMADHTSKIVTNEDLTIKLFDIASDTNIKALVMNAAMCDFEMSNPSTEQRLSSSKDYKVELRGVRGKLITDLRKLRPDLIIAGFKTTAQAGTAEMMGKGFMQIANSGVDFCLANDIHTRTNMLLAADGCITRGTRDHVLRCLVDGINHEYLCKQWDI
jgi:hypothetical protein